MTEEALKWACPAELIEIEHSLWTNDPEVYEATYTEDAILIFSEVGRISRSVAVDAIRRENKDGKYWAEVQFEEVVPLQLVPEVVLLTYKAIARWNYQATATSSLCATVYVKRNELWKVAFHQQSAI